MVDREGEGPLLILLHGIGGNRSNWRAQLPDFSKTFHCLAWDARGYGDSDDYEGPLDFEDFAHDLLRVIDHFDAERAHLCGLSMGGQIAQCFYRLYPERVASLVLAATFTHWGAALGDAALEHYLSLRLKPLQEEGKEPSDIADAAASALLGPTATEAHHSQLANSISTLHKESYIKTLQSAVPYDRPLELESIRVPSLYLYGQHDPLCPPELGRKMANRTPDSRFFEIVNSGHLINIEQPKPFNQAVLHFLNDVTATE